MTKREACIISAYTGTMLCGVNTLRQFLLDERLPDPFMCLTPEEVTRTADELKEAVKEEFITICESVE